VQLSDAEVQLVVARLGSTHRRVAVGHDEGALADALRADGFDAYACSPEADDLSPDDRHREDLAEHLAALDERTLGAVVVVNNEGRRTPAGARRLCAAAVRSIVRNGAVVVVSVDPATWCKEVGPVAADLAAGPAFRPETWAHLLTAGGGTVEAVEDHGRFSLVVARRRT
jgi:hypothetical protein